MATEVQDNFLDELRELMSNYNVEIQNWNEDGYRITTTYLEPDDENFICIDVNDV